MREGIWGRGDAVVLAALAVTVRMAFLGWTGRIWEDALITIAHARNAVEGAGLTHHVGEPVTHGFTSALSVVLPLIGEAIAAGTGIELIRAASLIAAALTVVVADQVGRNLGLSRWPRVLVMGFLAVDPNHVFYGMSGMETQIAVAAMLVALWAHVRRSPWLGVTLGVAILARPDFLLLGAAIGIPLFFRDRARCFRAVALAAAVLAPWVLFCTVYYGSPIPNTILAKAIGYATIPWTGGLEAWIAWIGRQAIDHVPTIVRSFSPFLEDSLVFGAPIPTLPLLVFGAAMLVFAFWGFASATREAAWHSIALFAGAYLFYRVFLLPSSYFDWYAPPFTAVAIFGVAGAVEALVSQDRARAAVAIGVVAAFTSPLPWMFQMERIIQYSVEQGVRVPAALRLSEFVTPGEGVISESAGYIGFHSRVTLLDYPGLTSPTALTALRGLPPGERSLVGLIHALDAPWLALRPGELALLEAEYPETAAAYEIVARLGEGRRTISVGGYEKLTVDDAFMILRRRR